MISGTDCLVSHLLRAVERLFPVRRDNQTLIMSFQAVSVVGRGEPVYSASPLPSYDARTLQMGALASPGGPAMSPQLSNTYTHLPVYSQSLAQAHEMSMGAHNVYHLTRPEVLQNIPSETHQTGQRSHKTIPEIFLTRLLSTKGTVQKFVDDFFGTILKVPHSFPPPVKWLFDILDDAARQSGVHNLEVRSRDDQMLHFQLSELSNFVSNIIKTLDDEKLFFHIFTMERIFI